MMCTSALAMLISWFVWSYPFHHKNHDHDVKLCALCSLCLKGENENKICIGSTWTTLALCTLRTANANHHIAVVWVSPRPSMFWRTQRRKYFLAKQNRPKTKKNEQKKWEEKNEWYRAGRRELKGRIGGWGKTQRLCKTELQKDKQQEREKNTTKLKTQ